MSEVAKLEEVLEELNELETVTDELEAETTDEFSEESDETSEVEIEEEELVDEVPLEYPDLDIIPDGVFGIPQFTDKEKHILKNNLLMDIGNIESQYNIMDMAAKDYIEFIKNDDEDDEFYEMDKVSARNSLNLYIAARNILINFKLSIDEYYAFVKDNTVDIMKKVNEVTDKSFELYIADVNTEFGVDYKLGEGISISDSIIGIASARCLRDGKFINLFDIVNAKDSTGFEEIVRKLTSAISMFVATPEYGVDNISKLSTEEQHLLNVCSILLDELNGMIKAEPSEIDGEYDKIDSPKNTIVRAFYNIHNIIGKKYLYKFKEEKKRLKNKNTRVRTNRLDAYILNPKFIRSRLELYIAEVFLKKWISKSIFGSSTMIEDREKFSQVLTTVGDNIKVSEVYSRIINVYFLTYIFEELGFIISNYPNKALTSLSESGNPIKFQPKEYSIIKMNIINYFSKFIKGSKDSNTCEAYESFRVSCLTKSYVRVENVSSM